MPQRPSDDRPPPNVLCNKSANDSFGDFGALFHRRHDDRRIARVADEFVVSRRADIGAARDFRRYQPPDYRDAGDQLFGLSKEVDVDPHPSR